MTKNLAKRIQINDDHGDDSEDQIIKKVHLETSKKTGISVKQT